MTRCVFTRPICRAVFRAPFRPGPFRPGPFRPGLRRALVGLALALAPAAAGLLAPVPAQATASDLPPATAEGWSVHRYLGGAIAQVRAADQGWFAVRCERSDHVGEIAYNAPDAGDRFFGGKPLMVEILFDDGRERISQRLVWNEVERHWTAPFGPRQPMAVQMNLGSVMRVQVEGGASSAFSLQGASGSLARMFEICD